MPAGHESQPGRFENKFRRSSRGRANIVVSVRCVLCVNQPGLSRPYRKNAHSNHELGRRAIKEKKSSRSKSSFSAQTVVANYMERLCTKRKYKLFYYIFSSYSLQHHRGDGKIYFNFNFFSNKGEPCSPR